MICLRCHAPITTLSAQDRRPRVAACDRCGTLADRQRQVQAVRDHVLRIFPGPLF